MSLPRTQSQSTPTPQSGGVEPGGAFTQDGRSAPAHRGMIATANSCASSHQVGNQSNTGPFMYPVLLGHRNDEHAERWPGEPYDNTSSNASIRDWFSDHWLYVVGGLIGACAFVVAAWIGGGM